MAVPGGGGVEIAVGSTIYNGQAGQGNQAKGNLAITTADGKNIAAAANTEQNSLANSYLNAAAISSAKHTEQGATQGRRWW